MTMDQILETLCKLEIADPEIIKSKNRSKKVTRIRDIASYYMHHHGYSYPEIAKFMGKNHSTILYGKRRAPQHLQMMAEFVQSLDREQRDQLRQIIDEQQEESNGPS